VESASTQAFANSQNKFARKIVICDPQELRPHPSYAGMATFTLAAK
jgi:hypothetical protein